MAPLTCCCEQNGHDGEGSPLHRRCGADHVAAQGMAQPIGTTLQVMPSAWSAGGRIPSAPSSDNQTVPDRRRATDGLKVEQIEARVSSGRSDHGGNSRARVGQSDVRAQVEQAEDGPSLLVAGELPKRPGEMAAGPGDGGAASPVEQ